jgi:DNA-binding response OmpR family regulator
MGVFMVECIGDPLQMLSAEGLRASDFAIVVGDEVPGHLRLVADLVEGPLPVVLAVTPGGSSAASYRRAGATACISDTDDPRHILDMIRLVGRRARELRADETLRLRPRSHLTVFGDIQFQLGPAILTRGSQSVVLSRTEREALVALAESPGVSISRGALEARIFGKDTAVSPGYLKTVVLRIKRKVASLGADPNMLGAVRGYGYVLRQ